MSWGTVSTTRTCGPYIIIWLVRREEEGAAAAVCTLGRVGVRTGQLSFGFTGQVPPKPPDLAPPIPTSL